MLLAGMLQLPMGCDTWLTGGPHPQGSNGRISLAHLAGETAEERTKRWWGRRELFVTKKPVLVRSKSLVLSAARGVWWSRR